MRTGIEKHLHIRKFENGFGYLLFAMVKKSSFKARTAYAFNLLHLRKKPRQQNWEINRKACCVECPAIGNKYTHTY